ncbi:MAG: hypothetical protein E7638_02875 [Ruminococcaceae bacterium]|nr:hypothetical protein [Oscillospiraceae bacterium]
MLYVLQYLAVICAFLLPWGILGSIHAKKDGDGRKLKIYAVLAVVSIVVVGATVALAFALN